MSLIRGSLTTLLGRVGYTGLIFIGTVVIIPKYFDVASVGLFAKATLLATFLALAADLGIGIANVYHIGRTRFPLAQIAGNSLVLAIIPGCLLAVGAYFLWDTWPWLNQKIGLPQGVLIVALISVPLLLILAHFRRILLGLQNIMGFNLVGISQAGDFLIALVIILLIWGDKLGIAGAVAAWTIGTLSGAMAALILVRGRTIIPWRLDTPLLSATLKYGLKGYFGDMLSFLNYNLDVFIVAFYLSDVEVGRYYIAARIASIIWFLPTSVGIVLFPRTASQSDSDSSKLTPVVARHTLFLTIIIGLFVLVFGYGVIWFQGADYSMLYLPLTILWPGVIALSLDKVISNDLMGRGKQIINSYAALVVLVVDIGLNIILIPKWGINGAAVAASCSYIAGTVVTLIPFLVIAKVNLFDVLFLKKKDWRVYADLLTRGRQAMGPGSHEGYRFPPEYNLHSEKLGHYYLDFSEDLKENRYFDENGIPTIRVDGEMRYHYVTVAQYALGMHTRWLLNQDPQDRAAFLYLAGWLRSKLVEGPEGSAVWQFDYDWPRIGCRKPWPSALAQAQGASVLLRAADMGGGDEFKIAGMNALKLLHAPVGKGGVQSRLAQDTVVLEEYPESNYRGVFNGYMFAFLGIYDGIRVTADSELKVLLNECALSLRRLIQRYDTGYWSLYDLSSGKIASPFYHQLHIDLLKLVHDITGDHYFMQTARAWEEYQKKNTSKLMVLLSRISHKFREG